MQRFGWKAQEPLPVAAQQPDSRRRRSAPARLTGGPVDPAVRFDPTDLVATSGRRRPRRVRAAAELAARPAAKLNGPAVTDHPNQVEVLAAGGARCCWERQGCGRVVAVS